MSNEITPVVKLSLTLPKPIHDALKKQAQQERRELGEHLQRVLSEHVINNPDLLPESDARRLRFSWELVGQAVEAAKQICRDGKFSRSITLDAILKCMEDPNWVAKYREVVGDDIYKNGNPRKGPINREIGYRIRAGIDGLVEKVDGKPVVVKVLGQIIQSYTPMEDYSREAVGYGHAGRPH